MCQVVLDQVSALERDFAGSIPSWLGANVVPANIDDRDLAETMPLISRPVDQYTVSATWLVLGRVTQIELLYSSQDMSYSLYAFGKFKQFRELSDQVCREGGRLDYQHVNE